jgi:outer membrane protein assembly factor BamB
LLWEAPFRYTGGGEAVNSMLTDGDSLYACSAGGAQARSLSQMAQKREGLLWRTELKGRGPNTASPVLCNGLLFMVSDNGEATCLDARDGRLLWQERLPGRIWMSSPVAVGDRILFSNGDGATVVVAAERQFRILAENRLDAAIYASLAPADDQLFIRTTKDLWCIGPR